MLESEQPPTFIGNGEIGLNDEQAMELIIYNGTDFNEFPKEVSHPQGM